MSRTPRTTHLARNAAANGCHTVQAIEKAVASQSGTLSFSRDRQGAEGYLVDGPPAGATMPVGVVSLEDFFAEEAWPAVDVVKMDIEGSERSAPEGMREVCRRNPALLVILELNSDAMRRSGTTHANMAALLLSLGFHQGQVIERNLEPFTIGATLPGSGATYNVLLRQ